VPDMGLLVGEERESALTEGAIRYRPRGTEENYETLSNPSLDLGLP